ncbi:putative phosphoglycerate mutase family protein [Rosellinia necatrix]|uniref:Putative phosphoglycerate mutase family protein n=1 Tax=Rosellinia necatrix TaxID=77044 RepID=A0A1S7UKF5_ROSNE|nr:putative phosphoglycerate mutase family protein [Rosellinia necatrix]
MRLLPVRHGESVDNVAGLYAGSRDSSLTNHGILQAKRLGAHIAGHCARTGPIRHLFASNLQRAYRTAEAIADACQTQAEASGLLVAVDVICVEELREKDYGSSEGKKFGAKESDDGSESHESMQLRIGRFLDHHIDPIVDCLVTENATVVIVAHGIILNVLLKTLLLRYPPSKSSLFSPLFRERPGSEHLAPWSNTGVLQASFELSGSNASPGAHRAGMIHMIVEHVNNLDHLQGLKKTRGGIGSAKFDSRQRTMDSFLALPVKKRKFNDAED